MVSIKEVLDRHKGIGPGFDFLRIFLAVSIVLYHSFPNTANFVAQVKPWWFARHSLVPCFFALSGFLITASGTRLSLKNFLLNRGLRILPALMVDIFLCALIIGPLITTVSLSEYFSDKRFWLYFLNITGYIHYFLPGVFETNPDNQVNGALWTVPYEVLCYIFISCFIYFKVLNKPKVSIGIIAAMTICGIALDFSGLLPSIRDQHQRISEILGFIFIDRESNAVNAFLCGIVVYQLRDKIPYSKTLFRTAIAVCIAIAFLVDYDQGDRVILRLILLPALVYITVYTGLTDIKIPAFFKRGDYSYGIYLYHDPILQLTILLFPNICLIKPYGAFIDFAISAPFILLLAVFSWHFIEKPILSLRKKFSFTARKGDADLAIPKAEVKAE